MFCAVKLLYVIFLPYLHAFYCCCHFSDVILPSLAYDGNLNGIDTLGLFIQYHIVGCAFGLDFNLWLFIEES